MANPRARIPLIIGATVASGGAYYLYAAGGDTKVAQKKVEGEQHPSRLHNKANNDPSQPMLLELVEAGQSRLRSRARNSLKSSVQSLTIP